MPLRAPVRITSHRAAPSPGIASTSNITTNCSPLLFVCVCISGAKKPCHSYITPHAGCHGRWRARLIPRFPPVAHAQLWQNKRNLHTTLLLRSLYWCQLYCSIPRRRQAVVINIVVEFSVCRIVSPKGSLEDLSRYVAFDIPRNEDWGEIA